MKIAKNIIELKQIYTLDEFDTARKLAYYLGCSSRNNNLFEKSLSKMLVNNELEKVYDFVQDGFREALYRLSDGNEIEFFGTDHMDYKLQVLVY